MNKFLEWVEQSFAAFISALFVSMVGGIAWLVRQVITNQKQIALMEAQHNAQMNILRSEMSHRDQLRREDREDLTEVKASVKRVENFLLEGKR